MRVQDVMTEGVRTVPPLMPATDAWEYMRTEGIHHLVVVESGEIVGLLSDRDAGGRAGGAVREGRTVRDLMTRNVVTIDRLETVRHAASVMRGRAIGCLPVMRGQKLVGIVTTADLLDLLGRGVDRPAPPERRRLHHRVAHRHSRAGGSW